MAKRKKFVDMSAGKRIEKARKGKGLTMQQLAEATGLTQAQISHYENNRNLPNAGALISLAGALKVTTDYLLMGGNENDPPAFDYQSLTIAKKKIFDQWRETRHHLDEFINEMMSSKTGDSA